jgi:transposase InsO family protein
MSSLGLYASIPTSKYKSYKGDIGKKAPNLLLINDIDENGELINQTRDFTTTSVNQKWTTDVSEFHISEGKLYLSPILDIHNREIISYSISKSPNFQQIKEMLNIAFEKYDDLEGLIFHSDQGWQYQMHHYQHELQSRGIKQSMSRKGNCLDNSPMENFFGIMKNEMFYGHEHDFNSLEELEKAMVEYIEYYNKNRITTKLKGLSPLMYRQQSFNQLQY